MTKMEVFKCKMTVLVLRLLLPCYRVKHRVHSYFVWVAKKRGNVDSIIYNLERLVECEDMIIDTCDKALDILFKLKKNKR